MSNRHPNILFFFSDQQRFDTAGCYGQKLDITPNLDELARTGIKFENAYTCQPVCGPARACLQTGKYATTLGCYRNDIALPQTEKTLAHYVHENGYQAAYVGKWHLASTGGDSHEPIGQPADFAATAVPQERRGGYTDYWVGADVLEATSHGYGGFLFNENNEKLTFDGYRTDAVTDYALDFLKTRSREKPFFLFLSHIEPHHQNDRGHFEGPIGSKEQFKSFEAPRDLEMAEGDWGSNWRQEYPDYLGCCRRLDDNLGRMIEEFKRQGIYEDTIIVYTSDHGSHFKTRCLEYKRSCHDSSIHVPLVIHGGRFLGGKTVDNLVSLIDLPPTLLKMAGIDTPKDMPGRPIQRLLDGGADEWEDEVFLQISESQVGRSLRTKAYKYSVRAYDRHPWLDASADVYHEEYLYDLKADPHELHNLVDEPSYEAVRKELSRRLAARMTAIGEKEPVILPALPHRSTSLGLNARLEDLMAKPASMEVLKNCCPDSFFAPAFQEASQKLTLNEIHRQTPRLLSDETMERLLKGLTDAAIEKAI